MKSVYTPGHPSKHNPANTKQRPNVGPMLGHRLRRWPNIGPALGRYLVFARKLFTLCRINVDAELPTFQSDHYIKLDMLLDRQL